MRKLSMREVQLAELEILKEFDRICRKNKLKYTLSYGTLLGAVRHKGFIPWDDDIDVCMPRPDYEKFIEIFEKEKSGDRFSLTPDRGKNAVYPFLKILDNTITVSDTESNSVNKIWIDVFPLDGLPDGEKDYEKLRKKLIFLRRIVVVNKYKKSKNYNGSHSRIKFLAARLFAKLYGKNRAIKNINKILHSRKYSESNFAGVLAWSYIEINERLPRDLYDGIDEIEFEGCKFFAVTRYDGYLTNMYGDYMQLPPEDKRVTHGVDAFIGEE